MSRLLPPSSFTVPCKMVLTRPVESGVVSIPLQFAPLYDCLLDLGTDFLVGNMVFVRDAGHSSLILRKMRSGEKQLASLAGSETP